MVVSNILINIIGYSGAVVGTLFMLPQVVKSVWSKKVNDVSLLTVIGFVVNCALWLTYGLLIHAAPVSINNAIALIIGLAQLFVKIKYS